MYVNLHSYLRADISRRLVPGRLFTCQAAFLIFFSFLSGANGQVQSGFVRLEGTISSKIRPEDDQGLVDANKRLPSITMSFRRTVEQHAALDQLLRDQQDPSSADFHKWLTPEQFAERFGITSDDVNQVAAWLRAEGFIVDATARSRGWIAFSGTAAKVQKSFQTEIHRYRIDGKMHFAVSKPPAIPAPFEPLIGGIRGLDDFFPVHSGKFEPLYTAPNGTHAIAPQDLARIYTYSGTTSLGQGQTIAVVGQSDIKLADIEKFRSTFLLPFNDPKLLLVGEDPGIDSGGGELEADLDLEWSGAVASQANIVYVYAQNAFDAAQQAIDQNLATILSSSYTACESGVPAASAAALRDLAQQANAQGMTWVAASGDAGAAACDQGSYPATQGLAVNLPASFPEVTGIGGTEFNDQPNSWQPTNGDDFSSVNGYIPEIAWNDTSPTLHLEASGGGASALYAKPAWQIGPGVPNDGARDVPDLAFTASPNHDPFLLISGGQTYTGGGTSVSAPVFAGMLALEQQQMAILAPGVRLGNINPTLYVLAAAPTPTGDVAIFHDVTSGNNSVPCANGTPNCVDGSLGYNAGPGYDLVTGLGSINVASF